MKPLPSNDPLRRKPAEPDGDAFTPDVREQFDRAWDRIGERNAQHSEREVEEDVRVALREARRSRRLKAAG